MHHLLLLLINCRIENEKCSVFSRFVFFLSFEFGIGDNKLKLKCGHRTIVINSTSKMLQRNKNKTKRNRAMFILSSSA